MRTKEVENQRETQRTISNLEVLFNILELGLYK